METYWWWAVVGIALIIAELVSGTFYLLVIGIAALAGAGVAFYSSSFWLQAEIAAAVAIAGVIWVTRYRKLQMSSPSVALDVGQSVVLDSWISEKDRLARVRYRNALWDARLLDVEGAEAGHVATLRAGGRRFRARGRSGCHP